MTSEQMGSDAVRAPLRVAVADGEGWVGRFGDVVCWCRGRPAGQPSEEFMAVVERTALEVTGPSVTRRVGRWLARMGAGTTDGAIGFGMAVIAVGEEGLSLIAYGEFRLVVVTGSGSEELCGSDAAMWVDRIIGGELLAVEVAGEGTAVEADPPTRLDGGIVRGGGVRLTPPPIISPPAPDGPMPVPPAEPEQLEDVPGPSDEAEQVEAAAAVRDAPVVEVQGRLCVERHFNHPDAVWCQVCGRAMWHTMWLTTRPRPPLGVLTTDDGINVVVDRNYVLGRDPAGQEVPEPWADAQGRALSDPTLSMSRMHCGLLLDGWDVSIADLGSANGTWLRREGEVRWERIGREPVMIRPGTYIALGKRVMLFSSHLQIPK
ncbi:hypothetical protein BH23ACT9_BH23ACT9_18830 [soil metagenome]